MPTDRLDALLQRFSVRAQMFHSGPLCGAHVFPEVGDYGQLHLVRRGPVQAHHGARRSVRIREPSLIFYPRPLRHRLITDADQGADLACANLSFNAGPLNPLAQALPDVVVLPLAELTDAQPLLDALFREAFTQACGRQHVVNRLFEVVIILILRHLMDRERINHGLLAGMADPRIAKALVAMHEGPGRAWPLEKLALQAGMSRSQFAAVFQDRVGIGPGEYLAKFRISIAQDMLRRGAPLKQVASDVGYGSAAALSRAFSAISGQSPRMWKTSAS